MNGIQKVIKYGAIALAVFIIVNIFSFVIYLVSSIVDFDDNDEVINFEETYENVNNIKIDASSTRLNIKQGDTFKVEASSVNDKFKVKLTNGTLKIEEKSKHLFNNKNVSEVTVYVPNVNLDLLDIDAGAGSITIENINTNDFDFDQGAGTITISNSNFIKANIDGGAGEFKIISSSINNLDLDAGVGKVEIEATLTGKNKIDCGVGEVNIDLLGNSNDYKIKTNKGLGSININGESKSNDTTYGDGSNIIEIEGGIGSINITTQGR